MGDSGGEMSLLFADSVTPSTSDSRSHFTTRSATPDNVSPSSAPSCMVCTRLLDLHLSDSDANRAWRVCHCAERLCHAACARADPNWVVRRCLECAQRYRQPPLSMIRVRVPLPLSSSGQPCSLCGNERPGLQTDSPKVDLRWVRPCFCEYDVHHICMVDHVLNHKSCPECGIRFEVSKYGSLCDYAKFNVIENLSVCTLFLIVSGFSLSRMYQEFPTRSPEEANIALFVLFVLLLFLSCIGFYIWAWWTIRKRFPAFSARFGQISVLNYNPSSHCKMGAKPRKNGRKLRTIEEHSSFLRNWSMNSVLRTTGRQQMSTSTPKDGTNHQVKFTFATPAAKNGGFGAQLTDSVEC